MLKWNHGAHDKKSGMRSWECHNTAKPPSQPPTPPLPSGGEVSAPLLLLTVSHKQPVPSFPPQTRGGRGKWWMAPLGGCQGLLILRWLEPQKPPSGGDIPAPHPECDMDFSVCCLTVSADKTSGATVVATSFFLSFLLSLLSFSLLTDDCCVKKQKKPDTFVFLQGHWLMHSGPQGNMNSFGQVIKNNLTALIFPWPLFMPLLSSSTASRREDSQTAVF